ncbi:helix-turn-helix domain-containing protein [Devosia albogilva]|uniref:Helix-turn-helix domain-containing protein n=1 Tax=Devosia albogilva TaxID=429726 RepID=A0ABW5QM22_9HYPH
MLERSSRSGDGLTLRQRVRLRLDALELSPTQVSKRIGKRDFVGQLLRQEKNSVTDKNLQALAKALETTVRYLATGEEDPEPPASGSTKFSFFRPGVPPGYRQMRDQGSTAAEQPLAITSQALVADSVDQACDAASQSLSEGRPLPSNFWKARLRPLPKITALVRERARGDAPIPSRPMRTALPVFQLQPGSVGDILNIKMLDWTPRPHDLIGVPDAYAVRLNRDLAVGWRSGSVVVLTPLAHVNANDVVLAIHSAGQTGNHLVELRSFVDVDLKQGIRLQHLPGVDDRRVHNRKAILIHRVHSVIFPRAPETLRG